MLSHVIIPFINDTKKQINEYFDIDDGTVPDELTAVSWCDGHLPQVRPLTHDSKLFSTGSHVTWMQMEMKHCGMLRYHKKVSTINVSYT